MASPSKYGKFDVIIGKKGVDATTADVNSDRNSDVPSAATRVSEKYHLPGPNINCPIAGYPYCDVAVGNTIRTCGVLSQYVWEREATPKAPPATKSMLISVSQYINWIPDCVRYDENAATFHVTSAVKKNSVPRAPSVAQITMKVAEKIPSTHKWLATYITWTDLVKRRTADSDWTTADVAETFERENRAKTTSLRSLLRLNDQNVANKLAALADYVPIRYDNTAIYAKLWYLVLGQHIIDTTNGKLKPFAWNEIPSFVTFQGDDADEDIDRFSAAVGKGALTLVENRDFDSSHLSVLCALTFEGLYFESESGANVFPFQTVHWPAIPVTLIMTSGAVPVKLSITRAPAQFIRQFLLNVAEARGEIDDCVRGFYFASDLVGSNAVVYEVRIGWRGDHRTLVTPYHECIGCLRIPKPHDSNALFRLLVASPAPPVDAATSRDFDFLRAYSLTPIVHSCLVSSAILSAMTTTVFYSFQICGSTLQQLIFSSTLPPDPLRSVLQNSDLFAGSKSDPTRLPLLFLHAHSLVAECCGFARPTDYLVGRNWCSLPANLPGVTRFVDAGLAIASLWPYSWGNLLAVDRWLRVRPLEWGVCAAMPSFDCVTSPPDGDGNDAEGDWYAQLVDTELATSRLVAENPFRANAFAAYAVNVMCQHLELGVAPKLDKYLLRLEYPASGADTLAAFGGADFARLPHTRVQVLDAIQPAYSSTLRTFDPCTIMSYDAMRRGILTVRVPNRNMLSVSYLSNNFVISNAGLFLSHCTADSAGAVVPPATYTLPVGMSRNGRQPLSVRQEQNEPPAAHKRKIIRAD